MKTINLKFLRWIPILGLVGLFIIFLLYFYWYYSKKYNTEILTGLEEMNLSYFASFILQMVSLGILALVLVTI
jgi:magnesium-transporting ATPase (P-type)